MEQDWVHSGMQLKLEQISQLLTGLPESASVSITSVDNLARELFTHRGAGTLIRVGEQIIERTELSPDFRRKAAALLEQSFGRKLRMTISTSWTWNVFSAANPTAPWPSSSKAWTACPTWTSSL